MKVEAIVNAGFLEALVSDLAAIPSYWDKFLMDYPDHPIANSEFRHSTLGFTLYRPCSVHSKVSFSLTLK